MNVIKRLLFKDTGEPLNFLMHPFLWVTLLFGVAFVFPALFGVAGGNLLYQATVAHFGMVGAFVWGTLCLLLTVVNSYFIIYRKWQGASWSALIGEGVWIWSFLVYMLGGFFFQALVLSLPNMYFWGWYYFRAALEARETISS